MASCACRPGLICAPTSPTPPSSSLLLTGIRGHAPADGSTLREAFCPYRGLLPFREEDAGLFFGRETETEELVGKLREHNLITLVGRSGSGKSSIVYAGLIPALRRRADGRIWSILSLRPGPEPLHALVRAFDSPRADLPPFEADQRIEQQVESCERRPALSADASAACSRPPASGAPNGSSSMLTSGRSSTPRPCANPRAHPSRPKPT